MAPTPTHIFQTWKTSSDIPEYLQAYQRQWIQFCKDNHYEYTLYSDQELRKIIISHFPQFQELFDGFTHNIERVDFSRYAILYLKGGVYADLDTVPIKPLDKFLKLNRPVLGCEPIEHAESLYNQRSRVICNAFMISPPGHKMWLDLMTFIKGNYVPHGNPVYNTGPMAMTLFYESPKWNYPDVAILGPCAFFPITDVGHSTKYDGGFNRVSRECNIERDSYVAHLWAHEWNNDFDQQFLDLDNWILVLLSVWVLILIFPPLKQE